HGCDRAERRPRGQPIDRGCGQSGHRRHHRAPEIPGDGQPGQGEANARGPGSRGNTDAGRSIRGVSVGLHALLRFAAVSSTKPPSGTRDFLPDEIRRREYVTRVVRDVYEQYGFEPLETPAFENIETLLGKYGEEGNKLIFKILRRGEHEASGEADLALRYDLTVPLARVVAQYQNDLPRLFKRYQIQPVWRADRPGKGRFREFFQCDIDSMGSTSPVIEIELLSAVSDVLVRLGFDDFVIRLNHRRVLTALLTSFGIPAPQHEDALVALDKLDKIGADGVAREFSERGIDTASTDACHRFFARGKTGADVGTDWFPRIEQQIPTDDSTQ